MRRNLIIIFNAVFWSVFLWFFVNLGLTYTYNFSVPLSVKSSSQHTVSSDIPSSVDITLKAKGWDLLSLLFGKNLNYTLDLTGYKKDIKINLLQNINESGFLPEGLTAVSVYPDAIDVSFDNIISKTVKIKNLTSVLLKEGYTLVGNPEITPDSAVITGANSVISKIKFVSTERIVFKNISESFSRKIKLSDTLGSLVTIKPEEVNISYKIELSAEKSFDEIEVTVKNKPEDKDVLIVPPKIIINVRGGVEQLAKLNPSEIKVSIDYSRIESDEEGYIVPTIDLPENLSIIKIEPQQFQYIIKKKKQD